MKKRLISLILTVTMVFSLFFYLPTLPASAASTTAISRAGSLYTLGLFKGTGTNADGSPIFDLDKPATRAQAVVMLVRLLGKEGEAKSSNLSVPFTDVEDWAKPYIGYAYVKGLSNGTSSTTFGSEDYVTVSQFLTLVLRALGYSSSTDFQWDKAYVFSDSIGLTNGNYNSSSEFLRADAALISYSALSQKLKGNQKTLLAFLFENGSVTSKAVSDTGLDSLLALSVPEKPVVENGLGAEKIFAKCSPAVFRIDLYNSEGKKYGQASGFFIRDDGLALTNYLVISGAYSIKITTSDGKTYDVKGVYDTDVNSDIALLQIDGKGFSYLTMGDSDTVTAGQVIYTLGNPRGLDNTISDGLISHKSREVNGSNFIQISAPIALGSNGGALLDKDGNVVGITQKSSVNKDGQNLNYAVPINAAKKLSQKEYRSLSLGYLTKVIPSSQNSAVPDFGSVVGASPFIYTGANDETGFIFIYEKSRVSLKSPVTEYTAALYKYGYKKQCQSGGAGTPTPQGTFFSKDTHRIAFELFIINGVEYYTITYSLMAKNPPLKVVPYPDSRGVTDLGVYFGITPVKVETSSANTKTYIYKYGDLNSTELAFMPLYNLQLEANGYKYIYTYSVDADGQDLYGYVYELNKSHVFIGRKKDENGTFFIVKVFGKYVELGYDAYPSVPDFGKCFNINSIKKVSRNGWDYYYYSRKLISDITSIANDEYGKLLYDWGFTLKSEYSKDGVSFYSNDNYMVGFYDDFNGEGYAVIGVCRLK